MANTVSLNPLKIAIFQNGNFKIDIPELIRNAKIRKKC